jgi:uncharacterized damage-inducible protein DinB
MSQHEIDQFIAVWDRESSLTRNLLQTLPQDQLDFRPDPQGRSLGELAWHLVGIEAIFSSIAKSRNFGGPTPAGDRPRTVAELVAGYDRIHREAVERVRGIAPEDLDREFPFFGGQTISVRNVLWYPLLHHSIHHRGQLMMMVRLAGGVPSRVYGPNREEMPVRAG